MGLGWIADGLRLLSEQGRRRVRGPAPRREGPYRIEPDGLRLLDLCSNDYLGLGSSPAAPGPSGAGASRLVSGDLDLHAALEAALADWLGTDRALLFTSGYAANVGAIQALAGPDTLVVSDELNHASLVDGCRLSRARVVVTPHRDTAAIERALAGASGRKLVVTDGYFSMDAQIAPVAELRRLCDAQGAALLVDEAHALGVLGPGGRGVCAEAGIRPDVLVGTLGKAVGVGGAFVAGSTRLHDWLWNCARSFVFSTGLSPVLAATATAHLAEVRLGIRTQQLSDRTARLRGLLSDAGLGAPGVGPILPLAMGTEARAVAASARLREEGFHVHPIRPPTVAADGSRLRVTARADLPEDLLPTIAAALVRAVRA